MSGSRRARLLSALCVLEAVASAFSTSATPRRLWPLQRTARHASLQGLCRDQDVELFNLLIQRAVQTTCYTAKLSRDSPTSQWLETFAGHEGIALYHGLQGLRVDWSRYLRQLLRAAPEQFTVHSMLKKHRGLSANNPYLQPTPMTYTHEVQPSQIAEKVMAAGRLIASEWRDDLLLVAGEESEVWARRADQVKGLVADHEAAARMPAFSIDQDNSDDSPYRGGNYDLLKALLTRQAASHVLRGLLLDRSRAADAAMLQRLLPRFEGELSHHASDSFVATLLDEPCAMASRQGEPPRFTDPLAVGGLLLTARLELATAWAEQLEEVPAEFLAIKQEWLDELAAA